MRPNPQETADLITFTEEIRNGKLHFLYGGGPTMWNYFVEDCLKSIKSTTFLKFKMKSKLLNFDDKISYF